MIPAAFAWLIASIVCGITPSSAATTKIEAVLEEDGKNYLVIEKDKVLKRVPVELGLLESDVELEVISSELKEND